MRFTADEIAGKHRQEVIDAFVLWKPKFAYRAKDRALK